VDAVIEWRRKAKLRLMSAFGGKCGLCGYDRCPRNLVFHHLDPSIKGDGFGHFQSRAWTRIVEEVRKCVMLCHNCHGEVHAGLIDDLSPCPRFDETYIHYRRATEATTNPLRTKAILPLCAHCRKLVPRPNMIVCSAKCREMRARSIRTGARARPKPSGKMLSRLLKTKSCDTIAGEFSVTGKTVRLWAHGYGIEIRPYTRLVDRVGFEPT
jgi:hypothetical protein